MRTSGRCAIARKQDAVADKNVSDLASSVWGAALCWIDGFGMGGFRLMGAYSKSGSVFFKVPRMRTKKVGSDYHAGTAWRDRWHVPHM
jgi:hypothetical protein